MNDKTKFLLALGTTALIIVSPYLSFSAHNYADPAFDHWNFATFSILAVPAAFCATIIGAWATSALLHIPLYRVVAATTLPWVLIFLFGPIHTTAVSVMDSLGLPTGAMIIFAAILALSALLMFLVAKREVVLVGLFLFALVSCTWAAGQIAFFAAAEQWAQPSREQPDLGTATTSHTAGPNIYWIIVDAYASPNTLDTLLNLDTTEFLNNMSDRGFFHVKDARSPYNMTSLTLAAIMSQRYVLDEKSKFEKSRRSLYPAMMWAARPPSTIAAAKKMGYEFYVIGNNWARCSGHHVKCLRPQSGMSYGVRTFLESTPIRWLTFKYARSVSNDTIAELLPILRAKNSQEPYFIFAHNLPPHPPNIYNSDCTIRASTDNSLQDWSDGAKPSYKKAVVCTNKRLIEFGQFISEHDPQAIVVIQGDHGTSFTVDWGIPLADWTNKQVDERTSILSLIRLPQECKNWLTPDINSVNLVKLIFGCIQKTTPDFVPNRSYIGTYSGPDSGRVRLVYEK